MFARQAEVLHMEEENKTTKEKLILVIESIENNNILEYLLTYVTLVLKKWG